MIASIPSCEWSDRNLNNFIEYTPYINSVPCQVDNGYLYNGCLIIQGSKVFAEFLNADCFKINKHIEILAFVFVCVFDKLKYSDYPVDRCRLIVAFVAVKMFFSEKKVPSERDDIEFERQKVWFEFGIFIPYLYRQNIQGISSRHFARGMFFSYYWKLSILTCRHITLTRVIYS